MATYTTAASAEVGLLSNLDYEETGSVSKAKAVVSAARAWLVLRPNTASDQGSSLSLNVAQVEAMVKDARRYVNANAAKSSITTGTRFMSINEGFR